MLRPRHARRRRAQPLRTRHGVCARALPGAARRRSLVASRRAAHVRCTRSRRWRCRRSCRLPTEPGRVPLGSRLWGRRACMCLKRVSSIRIESPHTGSLSTVTLHTGPHAVRQSDPPGSEAPRDLPSRTPCPASHRPLYVPHTLTKSGVASRSCALRHRRTLPRPRRRRRPLPSRLPRAETQRSSPPAPKPSTPPARPILSSV